MMRKRILVAGSLNRDIFSYVSSFVRPSETRRVSAMEIADGGKGLNQAVACARLGVDVVFLGCVGEDDAGHALLETLNRESVCIDYLKTDDEMSTGTALIEVESSGRNRILVYQGANSRCTGAYIVENRNCFRQAEVVLVQQEIPQDAVKETLRLAKEAGAVTVLNPAPAVYTLDECTAKRIDYLTPNETELSRMVPQFDSMEEKAAVLLELGVGCVIVTLGEKGCMVYDRTQAVHIPAYPVKAVDTTGAGDCFNGALAVRLAEKEDVLSTCRYACLAASLSVSKKGASGSMPTVEQVQAAWNFQTK